MTKLEVYLNSPSSLKITKKDKPPMTQTNRRLLRMPAVEHKTGLTNSAIYAEIKRNAFPRPVKIGGRSSAWVEDEVDEWIEARIEARRDASARKSKNAAEPVSADQQPTAQQ